MLQLLVCLLLYGICGADVYLHNPRGSNNRLNEKSATRTNANRLFDSQNNNRGGYNVGDRTSKPAGSDASKQYQMKYYHSSALADSLLTLEWTNQHGCGGHEVSDPHKQNCMILLQYMCQPLDTPSLYSFRDGVDTRTPDYLAPAADSIQALNRARRRVNQTERGRHESWDHYDSCYVRERNNGLFTADQKLKKNRLGYSSAIYTRQNPGGTRRGYECPEERDYFPYWHPTPWRDIAILTDIPEQCSDLQKKSFNTSPYGECVQQSGERDVSKRWNNKQTCEEHGAYWAVLHSYKEKTTDDEQSCKSKGYKWAVPHDAANAKTPACLVPLDKPDCEQAAWSRSNHLGNGRDTVPLNYTWVLPRFTTGSQRCMVRIRYNISTDDYHPYSTNASVNGERSPIKNNPVVSVGGSTPLRLAINTAQTGRVFQDRSHLFILEPRCSDVESRKIHNLNVRGKRGNIVQVYPAVEYDFIPNQLRINSNDLVHIQWTGSNTHNNGAPGGDGQVGNDGTGKEGTDRNNLVEIAALDRNYPLVDSEMSLLRHATTHCSSPKYKKWTDLALELASGGYYKCAGQETSSCVADADTLDLDLNDAPASWSSPLLSFKPATYYYMSTRNNNFSNRRQNGFIIVEK